MEKATKLDHQYMTIVYFYDRAEHILNTVTCTLSTIKDASSFQLHINITICLQYYDPAI